MAPDDPFDPASVSWPAPGLNLFSPDAPSSPPAFVEAGHGAWWRYAESYRFAGSTLIDFFTRTGHDQDFLALPVLFLYRHYAELSLKLLLRDALRGLERPVPRLLGHKLLHLWAQLRPALEETWPTQYAAELDAIEAVLRELDAADPGSDTFRFPVDAKGSPRLPEYLQRFDLVHFGNSMETYAHWVGGVADALAAEQDALEEMRQAEADAAPRDDEW